MPAKQAVEHRVTIPEPKPGATRLEASCTCGEGIDVPATAFSLEVLKHWTTMHGTRPRR